MYVAEDLTLKPIYGAVISNFYNSSLEKLDFGKPADAAEIINSFVREKTNGIIPNIFDETSLDVLSRYVSIRGHSNNTWRVLKAKLVQGRGRGLTKVLLDIFCPFLTAWVIKITVIITKSH